MPDIFVSHATSDDKVVSNIHDALEKTGIPVWVDHEHGLIAGGNWSAGIQDALNDCLAGLYVLSPTSAKSPECEAEYRFILSLGKRLYVALIEPVSKADFPYRLITTQYVNLQSDFDAGMAELVRAVQGGRDLDPASPATAQANPVSGSFPRWHLDVPLIGRESELADAQKALADNTRATIILGLGGVGKTRLAAEIVAKTPFNHGAVWQTIAPHTSLTDLTLLIRDHLGLPPTSEADTIWRALGQRAMLIVLDNAEDCAMPAAYAERINALDLSGGTRVLMTSREQWADVHGMTRTTLKAPSAEAAATIVKAMAAYEKPDMWQEGHEGEIAEAARFHPRLMWYAVQWSNDAPPDEVLHMLRTLEGSDAEKALDDLVRKTVKRMQEQADGDKAYGALRKLAVCRGGFTREAAQAIAGEVDSLKLLKRYGLVSLEGQRYFVDPLVIAAVGEDDSAHRPHYNYYYKLARQHDKKQNYLGLESESTNLEAAFEWAMAAEDGEDALWLANACGNFMGNRGRFEQRLGWIKRIVEALNDHSDDMLRANAQNTLAISYEQMPIGNRTDNLKRAITAYEAALVYRTSQAAPLDYAQTQNNLGEAYRNLAPVEEREANLKRAIAACEAALVFYTPQATPMEYAMTQNNLGNAYFDLAAIEEREANLKRAIAAYEAALEYYTPQAAPLTYAMTQNNLGNAYQNLATIEEREANLKRAIAAYEAALEYYTPQTAPLEYAATQNNLGAAYRKLSGIVVHEANLKRAIAAYEAALEYYTPQAAPLDYATTQRNLGNAHEDLGDLPDAIACWREAEQYYRQMGIVDEADLMLEWIADVEAKLRGGGAG